MGDGVEHSHKSSVNLLLKAWARMMYDREGGTRGREHSKSTGNTAELPDWNKGLQWRRLDLNSPFSVPHQAGTGAAVRWEAI